MKLAIEKSISYADCIRNLSWPDNGTSYRKIKSFIEEHSIDISHFDRYHSNRSRRKYELVEKACPVCGRLFKTKASSPREKITCSYACANTHFNGIARNVNEDKLTYRTICFRHHGKKCIVCSEDKIVAVHHMDGNHDNKSPENLIPLCPTHHGYWHSRYRSEIEETVLNYVENFLKEKNDNE